LFRSDTRHAARTFDRGFRWDFDEKDLNESARSIERETDDAITFRRKAGGHQWSAAKT
jgi:hypothetical protein